MRENVARAVAARAAALRGDSTDGFDPNGIQFASESGEHPEDPEDVPVKKDLELPGHTHTPQLIPGLNSPVPTIPLLGGGRGSVSAAPRPAAPSGQASSSAAPTGQPPARAVPSSPAAPRPSTPGRQEATPAAPGTAAEAARFGLIGAEYEILARDPAQGGKSSLKTEQERRVGLDLEKRGDVPGPITRNPTGKAEFIDAQGNKWDVKGFNFYFRPSARLWPFPVRH